MLNLQHRLGDYIALLLFHLSPTELQCEILRFYLPTTSTL